MAHNNCIVVVCLIFVVITTAADLDADTAKVLTDQPLFMDTSRKLPITSGSCLPEMDTIYVATGKEEEYLDYLASLNAKNQLQFYNHAKYSTDEVYRSNLAQQMPNRQSKISTISSSTISQAAPTESVFSKIIMINTARELQNSLLEGDLLVPNTLFSNDTSRRKKRTLPSGGVAGAIWGTRVPYKFASGYPTSSRNKVLDAMAVIEQETCIDFDVKTGSDVDYLDISGIAGCSSAVGRHGGAQLLSLDTDCLEPAGIIIHELIHALGVHHTHSRLDRDSYVDINTANVATEHLPNFEIYANQHSDPFSVEYDYQSLMHYAEEDFSSGGTVISPLETSASIGQRDDISFLDKVTLNLMYSCYDKTPHYWPMDEIDSINDKIVGTGEITGPTSGGSEFLVGLDGGLRLNALRLRGNDAYVNLGSHPNQCLVDPEFCTNGLSVLFWFKLGDIEATPAHLVSSSVPGILPKDRGFDIRYDKIPFLNFQILEIHFQLKDSCRFLMISNSFEYWTHIAITWSTANDLIAYVNGTAETLIPTSECFPTRTNVPELNPTLVVGKNPTLSPSTDADFYMDDLVIWEKELSGSEVNSIKDEGPYNDMPSDEGSLGRRETVIGTLLSFVGL